LLAPTGLFGRLDFELSRSRHEVLAGKEGWRSSFCLHMSFFGRIDDVSTGTRRPSIIQIGCFLKDYCFLNQFQGKQIVFEKIDGNERCVTPAGTAGKLRPHRRF